MDHHNNIISDSTTILREKSDEIMKIYVLIAINITHPTGVAQLLP